VLETLLLDLREPITHWSPGERLMLPLAERAGTLVLHDVGRLTPEDQLYVLDLLERDGGDVRVVSTSPTSLMMRVQTGAFLDTLYYRLNTVCVNVTA
jgi:DNA-binding NtrC family response regulator